MLGVSQSPGGADQAGLGDGVRSAGPAALCKVTGVDSGFKFAHELSDVGLGAGRQEARAQRVRVSAQFAHRAGDVDEAAARLEVGEECVRRHKGAVIVAIQRRPHYVGV